MSDSVLETKNVTNIVIKSYCVEEQLFNLRGTSFMPFTFTQVLRSGDYEVISQWPPADFGHFPIICSDIDQKTALMPNSLGHSMNEEEAAL